MSVGTEPDCIRNSTFGITHYYNVDVDRGFTSPRVKWFAYDAMIRRLMLARSVVIAVPPAAELQEYSPKADRALPAAIYGRTSDAMFLIAYFVVLGATSSRRRCQSREFTLRGSGFSIARWFSDF